MKTLLLTLFVALMLGISCSSSSGKVSGNEPEQDTVVRSLYDRSEEDYEFLSSRNKTLPRIHAYSVLLICMTV